MDFGLAKRWNDEVTGVHCKLNIKKGRGITGTVRYSSPNVHEDIDRKSGICCTLSCFGIVFMIIVIFRLIIGSNWLMQVDFG